MSDFGELILGVILRESSGHFQDSEGYGFNAVFSFDRFLV